MSKGNQRVMITKQLLKDALLKLLEKKHIGKISVRELCQEADINRSTFYRHYETPHDVLLEFARDFILAFYETEDAKQDKNDIKKLITRMCRFLHQNAEVVKLFIRNSSNSDFPDLFRLVSEGFLESRSVLYKGQAVDDHTLRLMTAFFSHGMHSLLRQWLLEDIPKTPEEVADILYRSFNQDFTFQ